MERDNYGFWIKTSRQRLGWTKYQLAKEVGIGASNLNLWEANKSIPNVKNFLKLTELFKSVNPPDDQRQLFQEACDCYVDYCIRNNYIYAQPSFSDSVLRDDRYKLSDSHDHVLGYYHIRYMMIFEKVKDIQEVS